MSCKCSPVLVPTNRGPYTYFNNETPSFGDSSEFTLPILVDGLPTGTHIEQFQVFDTVDITLSTTIDANDVWDSTLGAFVIPDVTSTSGIMIYCESDNVES